METPASNQLKTTGKTPDGRAVFIAKSGPFYKTGAKLIYRHTDGRVSMLEVLAAHMIRGAFSTYRLTTYKIWCAEERAWFIRRMPSGKTVPIGSAMAWFRHLASGSGNWGKSITSRAQLRLHIMAAAESTFARDGVPFSFWLHPLEERLTVIREDSPARLEPNAPVTEADLRTVTLRDLEQAAVLDWKAGEVRRPNARDTRRFTVPMTGPLAGRRLIDIRPFLREEAEPAGDDLAGDL